MPTAIQPEEGLRLVSAIEIERLFKLGHGTARKVIDAEQLPHVERSHGARRFYYMTLADAFRRWGPQ